MTTTAIYAIKSILEIGAILSLWRISIVLDDKIIFLKKEIEYSQIDIERLYEEISETNLSFAQKLDFERNRIDSIVSEKVAKKKSSKK